MASEGSHHELFGAILSLPSMQMVAKVMMDKVKEYTEGMVAWNRVMGNRLQDGIMNGWEEMVIVMGLTRRLERVLDTVLEEHGQDCGVHGGRVGSGVGEVQGDGQPDDADQEHVNPGPSRGQNRLVVTGKRRGRPRKGIVPDGLVQLQIQNFGSKFQK